MLLIRRRVVRVLEMAPADHGVPRSDRMRIILHNSLILPLRFGVIQPWQHRCAIPIFRRSATAHFDEGSRQIHQRAYARAARGPLPARRPAHDERNTRGAVVHDILPPQAVLAHVFTVIGGVDNRRVLRKRACTQRGQHLADLLVHPLCQTVIQLTAFLHDLGRHILHLEARTYMPVVQRQRVEIAGRDVRHRNAALIVLPVLLRHNQREVRRNKAHR